jgi:hypothetical protein
LRKIQAEVVIARHHDVVAVALGITSDVRDHVLQLAKGETLEPASCPGVTVYSPGSTSADVHHSLEFRQRVKRMCLNGLVIPASTVRFSFRCSIGGDDVAVDNMVPFIP